MEDLLRQYRRAARLKDVSVCLQCLRQIVTSPPGGDSWRMDLEALENSHMDHIRENMAAWMGTDNTAALEQTLKELAAFSDTTERRQLIADVAQSLEDMYRRRLLHKGNLLLEAARQAHADDKVVELIDAVQHYQMLGAMVYFKPTSAMNGEFAEIFEWYKDAVRRNEQQRQFNNALADLQVELLNPDPSPRLARAWSRVQACGEEIPPEVADKARLAIRRLNRQRRVLRRMAVTGAAIFGIIAGTGISSALLHWQRGQIRESYLAQLDQQWEFCSPEQYAATIELLSRRHGYLLKAEVVRNRAGRIAEFEEIWRGRQASFEQSARAFQTLVNEVQNWDTEALLRGRPEVDRVARETAAALHALDPGIQAQKLRTTVENWGPNVPPEWRAAATSLVAWAESPRMNAEVYRRSLAQWEAFKQEHQGRIDAAFTALLDQAEAGLATVNREADREHALLAPRQLLEKAGKMPGVSTGLVARWDAILRRADTMDADILRRLHLRQAIDQADSLPGYLAALQNYRDAFPQHQFSVHLEPLLARADFYRSLLTPETATNIPALQQPRAMAQAWESERAKKWSAIQAKLTALGGEKRLTDLRAFGLGRWQNGAFQVQSGFLEGAFAGRDAPHRDEHLSAGRKPIVEGRAYFPRANDVEPVFKAQTFHRELGDYVGKAELMPHCRFVDELLGMTRTAAGRDFIPDAFLARYADKLARMDDIPPLLRLRLLQFMTEQLLTAAPEGGRGIWTEFANSAAHIGGEINWLCTENREVKVANTHADEMIRRHFLQLEVARQYLFYIAALNESARNRPVWRGHAGWTGAETQPILLAETDPRELWIFRPPSGGTGDTWRVAALRANESWNLLLPLAPGEPLFAPEDGSTTCGKINRLRLETRLGPDAPTPKLNGWPAIECR